MHDLELHTWTSIYLSNLNCTQLLFLPRCIQCRAVYREKDVCLSVRPSVCLSNAWIVTTRKKNLSRLLNHTKEYLG